VPAYIIALVHVTDPAGYEAYKAKTPAAIAQFGGRFLARGEKSKTLEGPQMATGKTPRIVLLEFPTYEQATAFYNSETYQQAKIIREATSTATFLMVDGFTPPPTT
jgi:uncharacterized protein (DUF1330 family)